MSGLAKALEAFEEFDRQLARIETTETTARLERAAIIKDFNGQQRRLAEVEAGVNTLSKVLRPTEAELHRRAVLEAEIAETMSYQRHRLDKIEARLHALENPPLAPWRVWLWRQLEPHVSGKVRGYLGAWILEGRFYGV